MIPYEDLVASLASWRERQGLPNHHANLFSADAPIGEPLASPAPGAAEVEVDDFAVVDEVLSEGGAATGDGSFQPVNAAPEVDAEPTHAGTSPLGGEDEATFIGRSPAFGDGAEAGDELHDPALGHATVPAAADVDGAPAGDEPGASAPWDEPADPISALAENARAFDGTETVVGEDAIAAEEPASAASELEIGEGEIVGEEVTPSEAAAQGDAAFVRGDAEPQAEDLGGFSATEGSVPEEITIAGDDVLDSSSAPPAVDELAPPPLDPALEAPRGEDVVEDDLPLPPAPGGDPGGDDDPERP